MKVLITYEKPDVLRLILADMKAKGLKLKADTVLEYKGALQVRFHVETEGDGDEVLIDAAEPPAPRVAPPAATKPTVVREEDDDAALAALRNQSETLTRNKKGQFEIRPAPGERVLGPNESYEYPTKERSS